MCEDDVDDSVSPLPHLSAINFGRKVVAVNAVEIQQLRSERKSFEAIVKQMGLPSGNYGSSKTIGHAKNPEISFRSEGQFFGYGLRGSSVKPICLQT